MQPTGLYPNGYYQTFQQMKIDPALERMLFVYCQLEQRMAIRKTFRLYTLQAGISNIAMTHGNN